MNDEQTIKKPIDKWIPWFFVMFFVVIAILDSIFVTIAIRTHTGTVTEQPYERGLNYNQTLADAKTQDIIGWQSEINIKGQTLEVHLKDKNGEPLNDANMYARIVRPVQAGYDFEIPLNSRGKGLYSAPVTFPLPGQWHLRIIAQWQGTPYQKSKTIVIN
jgi:nitrogen fixation protein FixH